MSPGLLLSLSTSLGVDAALGRTHLDCRVAVWRDMYMRIHVVHGTR
jgi:hypothetical protein